MSSLEFIIIIIIFLALEFDLYISVARIVIKA